MNCVNHEARNGTNTCGRCGHWLCDECSIDIDGRIVCKNCVAELLNANGYGYRPKPMDARRYEHVDERHEHYERCRERRYERMESASHSGKRRISRFWLLMFSCVPGINYMFMGLIKRGIYALSAFLLTVYCSSTFGSPLIALVAGVMYVVSIFDGFKVRRMLLNGEYVEDGFSGITSQLCRYRIPIGIVASLMVASNFFSRPYYSIPNYSYSWVRINGNSVFLLIVIAAIIYFFIKPARKARKDPETDYIDKRDQI